jgi:hypothetical protein
MHPNKWSTARILYCIVTTLIAIVFIEAWCELSTRNHQMCINLKLCCQ